MVFVVALLLHASLLDYATLVDILAVVVLHDYVLSDRNVLVNKGRETFTLLTLFPQFFLFSALYSYHFNELIGSCHPLVVQLLFL